MPIDYDEIEDELGYSKWLSKKIDKYGSEKKYALSLIERVTGIPHDRSKEGSSNILGLEALFLYSYFQRSEVPKSQSAKLFSDGKQKVISKKMEIFEDFMVLVLNNEKIKENKVYEILADKYFKDERTIRGIIKDIKDFYSEPRS